MCVLKDLGADRHICDINDVDHWDEPLREILRAIMTMGLSGHRDLISENSEYRIGRMARLQLGG